MVFEFELTFWNFTDAADFAVVGLHWDLEVVARTFEFYEWLLGWLVGRFPRFGSLQSVGVSDAL